MPTLDLSHHIHILLYFYCSDLYFEEFGSTTTMFVKSFRRDVYSIEYLKIVCNFVITIEIFIETCIYYKHNIDHSFVI